MHILKMTRRRARGGWVVSLAALLWVTAACTTQVTPPTAADPAPAATAAPVEAPAADPAAAPVGAAVDAAAPAADGLALVGAAVPGDETYKGLPVGFTEDGFPYRGEPDAPIVMLEYSDYGCPFCNRHFVQTEPALDESYVRSGLVRVVFHDLPLASLHPNAPAAHTATLCVAAQGSAMRYWELRAGMFRTVNEWQQSADPLPTFARLAEEVGADITAYADCMAAGEQAAIVEARVNVAFERGFGGTPSFQFLRLEDGVIFELVGAQPYDQFSGIVDAALAGEMPQAPAAAQAQPEPQGIPFWATLDGWQPDPARPGYNVAGDQYLGSLDAPLTVIEFSDFQCPYCRQYTLETQPTLHANYVETGQVLWVFKHFPLNIHPQAPAAGAAAECAAEQGQFWAMHDLLFENMDAWSVNDPTDVLVGLAEDLELDTAAFAACLADPAIAARVESDLSEGAPFVQGTPTFIVIRGERGSIIPGALPLERFSAILDEELAAAGQ